ncbi:MAG: hypothetical protein ACOYL5_15135 [Phototrophicaceae bacterium]|jgi:hypothetical protein
MNTPTQRPTPKAPSGFMRWLTYPIPAEQRPSVTFYRGRTVYAQVHPNPEKPRR